MLLKVKRFRVMAKQIASGGISAGGAGERNRISRIPHKFRENFAISNLGGCFWQLFNRVHPAMLAKLVFERLVPT